MKNNNVKIEKLEEADIELITKAKKVVGGKPIDVNGGIIKEVGCALLAKDGKIFIGVSLDLYCGIGFCAEHSAVSEMVSHSNETEINTIVACNNSGEVMYPCGRCRELIRLIDKRNYENCWVIISDTQKTKLKELLPGDWM